MSSIHPYPNVCDNDDNETLPVTAFCEDDSFNGMANLLYIPQDYVLKLLFSRTANIFDLPTLLIFLVVYFFLMTITAGISVASGLFVPMMLVGATFGRIIGIFMTMIFKNLNPPIDESIYSLIGATAMMSGFARITISLCVIVTELTGNTQYLLPIMVAVMSAKWVGDAFSKSVYEELSDLKSIPYLEHHPPHSTYALTVLDVMNSNVICVQEVERLSKVVEILKTTNHNGFPVVERESDERPFTYKGFIDRKVLLILLERKMYHANYDTAPDGVLDYSMMLTMVNRKWKLENMQLPSPADQDKYLLDLRPYMDQSQVIVLDSFSFLNAYRLFQTQGLRHLPVINPKHQVVGIITRQDLLAFHFDH